MNRLILFVFLFASNLASAAIDLSKFPSLDDVLKEFYSNYDISTIEGHLKFEKRPDGWWIAEHVYSSVHEIVKHEMYWNYNRNRYTKISYAKPKGLKFDSENYNISKNEHFGYNYENCIFYGYVGWQQDVIQTYNGLKIKSDDVLYALGRAYSAKASDLINNNSSLADTSESFRIVLGENNLNASQLAQYRSDRQKAIDYYEKLHNQNPNFETIVGSIGVKAANEHLTSFLDLLIIQNYDEAFKALKANLYSPFFISIAKNYLNSCEENAILFVNGDNDTYPLYYVQAFLGIRKDVTIVNLSLLNTPEYIDMLGREGCNLNPIQFSITPDLMLNGQRSYYIIDKNNSSPISCKTLVSQAKDSKSIKSLNGSDFYYVKGSQYYFAPNTPFELSKHYILRGEMMVLDVVANYFDKRPIYFASTVGTSVMCGLQDYCQLSGLTLKLTNTKKENYNQMGYISNPKVLFNTLSKTFDYNGIEAVHKHDMRLARNQRNAFQRLVSYYYAKDNLDSMKIVLDYCMTTISNESVPYFYYGSTFTESLFQLNENEKAKQLAIVTANNVKAKIDEIKRSNVETHWQEHNESILNNLVRVLNLFDEEELAKEIVRH